jgi:guanylate kinase
LNNQTTGKVIVIVAPSGTGKSTLIKKLMIELPDLKESVSFTTRSMREGEVNGENYFFISKEHFEIKLNDEEFLEWAKVHDNFYGTYKEFVDNSLENGVNLLFDLDVQGCDSFKEYFNDKAQVIFIAPPSIEDLEKRLLKRGTETEESMKTRLTNAREELVRKDDFDYLIINDDFDRTYTELSDLVRKLIEG